MIKVGQRTRPNYRLSTTKWFTDVLKFHIQYPLVKELSKIFLNAQILFFFKDDTFCKIHTPYILSIFNLQIKPFFECLPCLQDSPAHHRTPFGTIGWAHHWFLQCIKSYFFACDLPAPENHSTGFLLNLSSIPAFFQSLLKSKLSLLLDFLHILASFDKSLRQLGGCCLNEK